MDLLTRSAQDSTERFPPAWAHPLGGSDEKRRPGWAGPTTTTGRPYGTIGDVTNETTARGSVNGPEAAAAQAQVVADQAGVRVCELHDLDAMRAAAALYGTVWRNDAGAAPASPELMRALSHAGGYVAGAYRGDRLVAAGLAFHSDGREADLHSHLAAVLPEAQGRDVGRALKLHQRSWALEHGLQTISWTYDPLLRRNAWFNLTKLGASVTGYLVNFYGPMQDAQNDGDESDRAVATWRLDAPEVVAAAGGTRLEVRVSDLLRDGARIGLQESDGAPAVSRVPARTPCVLVQIPVDLQGLRAAQPAMARRWRDVSRDVLEPLLAGRYLATGFTRSGWYILKGFQK